MKERSGPGSGSQEAVDLESNDRSRIESQGPGMLGEIGQQIVRIEEAHHGHPSGYIHRIDIVAVDERTDVTAAVILLLLVLLLLVLLLWLLVLIGFLFGTDFIMLIGSYHTGQGQSQVIAEDAALRFGQRWDVVGPGRDADAVRIEIDEPDVVGQAEVFLLQEERARDADDERRRRQ